MEENIKMNVTKEELEIIQFYRNLSEEKERNISRVHMFFEKYDARF